jgi:putative ABC transport system substrate-binding protein
MRRRHLLALASGAVLAPAARAQAMPVVGYLGSAARDGRPDIVAAFHDGLKEAGFVAGRNLALDYRSVEGRYERLPALAAEFVALRVAVIVAPHVQAALAARATTRTVPIAFHSGVDPVATGLVDSLARPGGNATGVYSYTSGLVAKRVELLRELVPGVRSLAFLVNPAFAAAPFQARDMQAAAGATGLSLRIVEARSADEIDGVFAALAAERPDALLVGPDSLFTSRRDQIVALAARHRLPAVYDFPDYPAAGGLISYGPSRADIGRLLGVYAGRIVAGARPADLPVQQPTRFDLVINLKTARALGLAVPAILLDRADEVIE